MERKKIQIVTTYHLDPDQIIGILMDFAKKELGCTPTGIDLNVSVRCTGYGAMEQDEHYFSGATIKTDKPFPI